MGRADINSGRCDDLTTFTRKLLVCNLWLLIDRCFSFVKANSRLSTSALLSKIRIMPVGAFKSVTSTLSFQGLNRGATCEKVFLIDIRLTVSSVRLQPNRDSLFARQISGLHSSVYK